MRQISAYIYSLLRARSVFLHKQSFWVTQLKYSSLNELCFGNWDGDEE